MSPWFSPPTGVRMLRWTAGLVIAIASLASVTEATAQGPIDAEVRQLVTFRLEPGSYDEVVGLYREQLLSLYEQDAAMLSLRAFREVESPVPLDLIIVRGFRGMAGMDDSNDALRQLAVEAGTSIGGLYGRISELSVSHDDQFVEMLGPFANGDPSSKPLVAMIWYRAATGQTMELRRTLAREVLASEREEGIPSATGEFLLSDGWTYLRWVGFDSLGDYQEYWSGLSPRLDEYVALQRQVIVAPVPGLAVR